MNVNINLCNSPVLGESFFLLKFYVKFKDSGFNPKKNCLTLFVNDPHKFKGSIAKIEK